MTANRSSSVMVLAVLGAVVLFMIPSVALGEEKVAIGSSSGQGAFWLCSRAPVTCDL